ncbi:uncharacterized protein LOC110933134 [Helianthus annuus]|uniref:uncharacterized protein LOC110933134 n=1 Tax=Helianthus annuus TaxID=4232 RepID=UPI000B8FB7D6|nr:uncharacterized protein LOC110933134 [Helianthus annuus]
MDGPLVLNEILSWLKKYKRRGMFFKVDIKKAYDSVNWAFLDSIMQQMNFSSRWRTWVMATLRSAKASVLVNGSPTREFVCSCGLRQGDPLSPFLFVMAMEALSGIMKVADSTGLFKGIKISNEGPYLSHLIYADDVMFVGEWSMSNINNLRRMLRCFYLVSGLKVNLAKCSIFDVGVSELAVQEMANRLKCKQVAGPWKNICSIRHILLNANIDLKMASSAALANGKSIHFWLDSWANQVPFYLLFPDLFRAETNKSCLVADRMSLAADGRVFNWAWQRPELNGAEETQFQQMLGIIGGLSLTLDRDKWIWKLAKDGQFSVASIKSVLSSHNWHRPDRVFVWNNWVPKKVGIVAWRADLNRLPTRAALLVRNVPVHDPMCVFCGNYEESSEHLFVSYHFAQSVWLNIASWGMIPPIIAFGINDLLSLHEFEFSATLSNKRKALHAVVLVAFWCIWKLRNEVMFRQAIPNCTKLLGEIKSMAYLWVKNRSKLVSITWEDWSRFSFGA